MAFPEVMQVLLGRVPDSSAASTAGWRIAALPGQARAAMVSAEAVACGRVVADLSNAEWQLIDAYETGCELRRIDLGDGSSAWCYVCTDQHEVSADDWDAEHFERDDFVVYLKTCATWCKEYQRRLSGL